jgi:hypothetical protein
LHILVFPPKTDLHPPSVAILAVPVVDKGCDELWVLKSLSTPRPPDLRLVRLFGITPVGGKRLR